MYARSIYPYSHLYIFLYIPRWSDVGRTLIECFYFTNNPYYRAMNNIKPFNFFVETETEWWPLQYSAQWFRRYNQDNETDSLHKSSPLLEMNFLSLFVFCWKEIVFSFQSFEEPFPKFCCFGTQLCSPLILWHYVVDYMKGKGKFSKSFIW